jgi:hypothetical protein
MIVDYILAGMVAEGAGLVAFRAVTGRGPSALVANFAAGAALLLAWRLSESGAPIAAVCAALAAAGVAHVSDLVARWREPPVEMRISQATIRMRAARRQGPDGVNRPSET